MFAPAAAFASSIALLSCAAQASAGTTIVNFDLFPNGRPVPGGTPVTGQWSSVGVVFSDLLGAPIGLSGNNCSYSAPFHAFAPTAIVATFVDPETGEPAVVSMAGTRQDNCWVPGEGIAMAAYDQAGALIAEAFNAGSGNLVTFTTACPRIAKVTMVCVGQGIDDFQFETPVAGGSTDLDGNGGVDAADLSILLGAWGPCACDCLGDIDHSGAVDASDLSMLLGDWG